MKWTVYNIYGVWCAENNFGSTIWALTEDELISYLNLFS